MTQDLDPDESALFGVPSAAEQERMVEAILFASAEPIALRELGARMPDGCDPARALAQLRERYAGRGVELRQIGAAWAFRTAPDLAGIMTREIVRTRKMSRAAMETLAIIAYHQPATRAEIEDIRGVAVSRGTLEQLLDLNWIRLGRRKMTPGRPVTFMVTENFLDHFGLSSTRDLPGVKELRAAGLLDALPREDMPEGSDGDEKDTQQEEALSPAKGYGAATDGPVDTT